SCLFPPQPSKLVLPEVLLQPILHCLSRPHCAALWLAAGCSGGAAAARWRRVQRGERGMIASGSARLGSGAKRAFILPYYVAAVVMPPSAPFGPDDPAALRSPRLD